MASVPIARSIRPKDVGDAIFAPPRWVQALVGSDQTESRETHDGLTVSVSAASHATFVRVRVADAIDLDALSFQRRTVQAYGLIAAALRDRPAGHAVRFWNHIPCIRADMGDGMDRYMVFNSGRFAAFYDWFGGESAFNSTIATATGVGHEGRDLVIDALAANRAGLHIQNPRQQRPFCYSCRYGPFPPCFARATLTRLGGDETILLVGGTSSVCGEESIHVGDLPAQTEETFCNLVSLVRTAIAASGSATPSTEDVESFAAFESARVYYLHDRQGEDVRRLVEQRLPHLDEIEYLRAELCRPELLIEIEGVVRIDARGAVR